MKTSTQRATWRYWLAGVLVAAILPWLFFDWSTGRHSGFALMMFSEIGLMIVFALSYNMQMGQAGLLSFGHAILFGLSGYATAHILTSLEGGSFWFPVELVPLLGGLAGLCFALVFGYLATKQRATAYAMITMGMGELVGASALMFMGFFGGEGGISTNRVTGTSMLGASYGPAWQVYYLIMVWMFIAVGLMYLHTQTPLGRMANATRDNFERAQFVGYDPRMVRFHQYVVSGFFAGIAGALYAVLYEIVTFDAVSAAKSANALLATYIGGAGVFAGPIIGAIVVVLLQSGVSLLSNAWLLYVGVLFIAMVMYAPGGLAGMIVAHQPIMRIGRMRELVVPYLRLLPGVLLTLFGFVALIELMSFTTIGAAQGKKLQIAGAVVDPSTGIPWLVGGAALLLGGLWLRFEGRRFAAVWNRLIELANLMQSEGVVRGGRDGVAGTDGDEPLAPAEGQRGAPA